MWSDEDWKRLLRYHAWSYEPTIEECASRAFNDVSRTLCYSIAVTKLEGMKKDDERRVEYEKLKKDFKAEVCGYIKTCIEDLKNEQDFDVWHEDTCGGIANIATSKKYWSNENKCNLFGKAPKNGEEPLTFFAGQAQKWLNMTLKNMWVTGVLEIHIKRNIVNQLHVPVDDYIIEATKKVTTKKTNQEKPLKPRLKKPYNFTVIDERKRSWSRWDYKDYKLFQEYIFDHYNNNYGKDTYNSPIEWEEVAWAEVAKKRKEDEN